VGGGLDHFLIAVNLHLGKTLHVLPGVAGQITGGMAEPQFGIRPLQVDLYCAIRPHFRVDNLRVVIQG